MSSYAHMEFDVVARKMLCGPDWHMYALHPELYNFLNRIDDLCVNAGGELRSRQVIASLVTLWMIQNLGKEAVSPI